MKLKDFAHISRQLEAAAAAGSFESLNIRSVQEQIEALARGDVAGALTTAQPDLQLDIFAPPDFSWVRHASGIDAVRDAMEHNFDALEDQRPEILNVLAQRDTVVLIGREVGRIRSTGMSYDVQFVDRFTFQGGRLAAIQIVAAWTV